MLAYTIGLPEVLIVAGVIILLFGAKKLPELARSMGKSTKEFKAGMREGAVDDIDETTPGTKPKPVQPD